MISGLPGDLRVLFVTYTVPWMPRYGGALRCHGVIRELAKRCCVHVALADSNPDIIKSFSTWPSDADVVRYTLAPSTRRKAVNGEGRIRAIRALLGFGDYAGTLGELENLIQPHIVWYFQAESLRRSALPRKAIAILDHDNVRWRMQARIARTELGINRYLAWLRAGEMRIEEVLLSHRVSRSLVASDDDINLFCPAHNVSVLPNGFDFPAAMPAVSQNSNRLLFYGSLFYKPNADGVRWMCQEIWPLIRAQNPDAHLDVVGLGDESLSDVAETPGVTFHGFVDDLDNMIGQAAALVVPLRVGGGTRIKILEAWAKGLPVVSTSVGAEGLGVKDRQTIMVGDTAKAFAACCIEMLAQVEVRQKIAVAAYEHGRYRFDWPIVGRKLNGILQEGLDAR